jgi:NTE family protein
MSNLDTDNIKIGLALGGGGARGLAHVGVLKVLERLEIPIACIAGTSMGGLVGALYANGYSSQEIEAEAMEIGKITQFMRLFDIRFRLRMRGLLKGSRIYRYMTEKLGEDLTFSDLNLPLGVVTTDIASGRTVVLASGSVAAAVRATISVPAIFEPVEFGDYRLVDGGMLNNVPVDVVRGLGADVVIAVDVLPNFCANKPGEPVKVSPLKHKFLPHMFQETYNVQLIMISALTEMRLRESQPEILIRPALPDDLGLFTGFDRPNVAIAAGEEAATALSTQIEVLLK